MSEWSDQWAYSMTPGTMTTPQVQTKAFGDAIVDGFMDIPFINEPIDQVGDTIDFVQDPSAGDFFEIITPAVVEDLFDGGGIDDLGYIPVIGDAVDGDGYTIGPGDLGVTVGPNAPSGAPQQPQGTVLGPDGQPIYTPPSCSNPNPTWAETPYFAERETACKTEHLIMKTFQGWIDEKEQELEDLKQKFDERVVRFQDEGCCNVPMDEAPEEEITFDSDRGGCGCSGGTAAPCGCGGHGSTPSASTRSASTTRSGTSPSPMETGSAPEPESSSVYPSSDTCSAAGTKLESCKRGGTVSDCSAAGTVLESCKRKTKRGTVRPRPVSSSICERPVKRRRTEPSSRKPAPNNKKRKVTKRRVETRKRKTKQRCS